MYQNFPMVSGLSLNNVSIQILNTLLINNLSFRIAPGSCGVIMGPSGCGKSSLINLICGTLDKPFSYKGDVILDGDIISGIPTERRQLGILFQDDLLFPHFSVGENIALAIPQGTPRQQKSKIVQDALTSVSMPGFADRDPLTLSSGQRARVSLVRCLSANPRAILLDEPFAKLHRDLRSDIRTLVFNLCLARQIPCLLVTHDSEDALAAKEAVATSFVIDLAA